MQLTSMHLCLISMNMTLCDCPSVCCKIWLLRQSRIDERSFSTHTHTHTYHFHSLAEWGVCVERDPPPHPPFRGHENFNGFVCVCVWYRVYDLINVCKFLFHFFAFVCASPGMEEGTVCVCLYVYVCACTCLVIWPLSDCSKFITKWHQPNRRQMMAGWKGALGLG